MRYAKLLLLLVLILALLPYLYTCFYALPFADDFCFGWTASEKISFAQKFLKQYLHWNGRYTSDVLVNFHPLAYGSLFNYQLTSFMAILAFPVVMFVFIRQWVNSLVTAIVSSVLISLFYLCYQPNITEGVYWYIGIVNYHIGTLCFILQLAVLRSLLNKDSNRIPLLITSLALLLTSIGFNEIGAALIPVYYLAAIIFSKTNQAAYQIRPQVIKVLILHFALAAIASALVVFSPGNCMRANVFPNRFNVPHSVLYASLQTIRFIGLWALSVPFIALSLAVLSGADKVKAGFIKKIDYRLWFTLLVFTVYIAGFLPYMATGILGQHRTLNYIFPYFIILWLAALISASEKYQLYQKLTPAINGFRMMLLIFVAVILMAVSGNSLKILGDVGRGSFQRYKSEFIQRQAGILTQPLAPIPAIQHIPNSFQVVDAKSDTSWWVEVCMKRYYTQTGNVLK